MIVLLICFFAQFMPWALVPRGTYIYHYFAAIPFLILCTSLVFETIETLYANRLRRRAAQINQGDTIASLADQKADRTLLILLAFYILCAAVLFVLLFPYASGWMVSTRWLQAVNWFGNLYY
jgi:dolichyl-phosphate-mannose-protein mannosyltransferase